MYFVIRFEFSTIHCKKNYKSNIIFLSLCVYLSIIFLQNSIITCSKNDNNGSNSGLRSNSFPLWSMFEQLDFRLKIKTFFSILAYFRTTVFRTVVNPPQLGRTDLNCKHVKFTIVVQKILS
jgi:hypothetical protein